MAHYVAKYRDTQGEYACYGEGAVYLGPLEDAVVATDVAFLADMLIVEAVAGGPYQQPDFDFVEVGLVSGGVTHGEADQGA